MIGWWRRSAVWKGALAAAARTVSIMRQMDMTILQTRSPAQRPRPAQNIDMTARSTGCVAHEGRQRWAASASGRAAVGNAGNGLCESHHVARNGLYVAPFRHGKGGNHD